MLAPVLFAFGGVMEEQPALEGEMVVLRPYSRGAGLSEAELRRQHRWEQDPEVRRLSGVPKRRMTFVEFKYFWEREARRPPSRRILYAIYAQGDEMIGRISCSGIDRDAGACELGIVIGESDYWDRGYGRDAICAFLGYLFDREGLQEVTLFTFVDNLRAQRSFQACGFRKVGRRSRVTLELEKQEGFDMKVTAEAFRRMKRDSVDGGSDGSEGR